MQRLPGERCRQWNQGGVAGPRACQVDPVELPDRCGRLACGRLQLRGVAVKQRPAQIVQFEVLAIAIHASIAGPH
ncbi:hypothetical protein G6F64_015601 [Rhizopus arrhizus]|uniref:Uncharacterized protein n=1 Tax=Rhizopus oryzae TaxID=64495 RepID=A0A9P7BI74_RHIOR|nr:hypothetical protein G6F64_015601 [Rhizopus arrhizus]